MTAPEYDPFGDRISIVQDLPTAPRTDPQSTVPVEPLSQLELDAVRKDIDPDDVHQYGGWAHLVARLLATLDAARASQPITARDALAVIDEAIEGYRIAVKQWQRHAETVPHDAVRATARAETWAAAVVDLSARRDRLAALPVREDEPTGIDAVAKYLRENAAYIEDTLATHPEEAETFAAHIVGLTREASHVR